MAALQPPIVHKGRVYLDHMATTPCLQEVVEAMLPYFTERFHNPQSFHPPGQGALEAVAAARQQVAVLIGAPTAREVFFTSGATESNNWALKGVAMTQRRRGQHIVTSQIEHFSRDAPLPHPGEAGFRGHVLAGGLPRVH